MEINDFVQSMVVIEKFKGLVAPPVPPNQWIPVISAVGGALVGGVISIFPSQFNEYRKRSAERRYVATALAAEINSLLVVARSRKYLESIVEIERFLSNKENEVFQFELKVPENYSKIYNSLLDRLGLLPVALARDIIVFYQLMDSVVQDVIPGGATSTGNGTQKVYSEMREMLSKCLELGEVIVEDVNSRY